MKNTKEPYYSWKEHGRCLEGKRMDSFPFLSVDSIKEEYKDWKEAYDLFEINQIFHSQKVKPSEFRLKENPTDEVYCIERVHEENGIDYFVMCTTPEGIMKPHYTKTLSDGSCQDFPVDTIKEAIELTNKYYV